MLHKQTLNLETIPRKEASNKLVEGCLVLEGGAFRSLYEAGVLDAMMLNDLNFSCVIGVSAGALNGMNYVSGQIGRSAYLNLKYRHDSRYVGWKAYSKNRGIIGFDFAFHDMNEDYPFHEKRFYHQSRRFIAVLTNCRNGKAAYFEKGKCSDIFQAAQASASLPFVSKMVEIDNIPYLDGGCSDKIPFHWAIQQRYKKIVVVRTRPSAFRKKTHTHTANAIQKIYHEYPEFAESLSVMDERYNRQCDELDQLEKQGKIYVAAPSEDIQVKRLERDVQKLFDLYTLGYQDMMKNIPFLRAYLEN